MLERDLNRDVMAALAGLAPFRIESAINQGAPDICFAGGWIEDKKVNEWPVRDSTPIRVPHYTTQQRRWHVRHALAGGLILVALRVAGTTFVFDGKLAAEHLGTWTRSQLIGNAALMVNPWDPREFRRYIDHRLACRSGTCAAPFRA